VSIPAAFFDVDGTLTQTNILQPLVWYQLAHLSRARFGLWAAGLLPQVPRYLWIDRRSRGLMNVVFYRRYAGIPVDKLYAWHRHTFSDLLLPRLFAPALECIREHKRQGHRVVLVTGGLECVHQPLAEFLGADELIAACLAERDGLCTGELTGPPVADEWKATLIRTYAEQNGIDLAPCHAYGDSFGDAPMLQCVGTPVSVNPDRRLRALAKQRNWRIQEWRGHVTMQNGGDDG
jgi:HAD superfamily hydrolase (TIGR01490 family)